MTVSRSSLLQGVSFATLATLCWASNFIAPYVVGAYGIHDLMLVRFLFAGVLGGVGLLVCRAQLRGLRPTQWLTGLGLGVLGYLGYSSCIAGGVIFGGPTLVAAFIGAVPVLQALLGNARERQVRWARLALPVSLLGGGVVLINLQALAEPAHAPDAGLGMLFATGAVLSWLMFSVVNQWAMVRLDAHATSAWTCLMMVGAGLGAAILLPWAAWLHLLRLPVNGLFDVPALRLYGWAMVIALFSSVIGAGAWNLASRRLPMVLSGQLIALESLFATVFGLAFVGRWPAASEVLGLGLVLVGTVRAVRAILTPARTSNTPHPPCSRSQ